MTCVSPQQEKTEIFFFGLEVYDLYQGELLSLSIPHFVHQQTGDKSYPDPGGLLGKASPYSYTESII